MASSISGRLGTTPNESVKAPVVAATTANITLSGEQTIDGVAVVAGNRVLVKDQTAAAENGIYVCASGAWTRAMDWDSSGDVIAGVMVLDVNGHVFYQATFSGVFSLGVTAVILSAIPYQNASAVVYEPTGVGAVAVTTQAKLRERVTVGDFGAVGDGVTDDTAAFQAAVNAHRVVYCPSTPQGYNITSFTIPAGHSLIGDQNKLDISAFKEGTVTAESTPTGTFFNITNTAVSPVILKSNSTLMGIHFFYPSQNWAVTSLADTFVSYPPCIQLGDVSDPVVYNCTVKYCTMLGGTTFVQQYAIDGSPIVSFCCDSCGGWLLNGMFFDIHIATDVTRISNIHVSPNYVTDYAVAKGSSSAQMFRTAAIANSTTRVFNLGRIDEAFINNVFAYGVVTFADINDNVYSGDTNEGCSLKMVNVSADVCQRMFHIKRSSPSFGISVANGFCTPILRPAGGFGVSADQAFVDIGAGVVGNRVSVRDFRIFGNGVGPDEFAPGYLGGYDYAFTAASALAASNNLLTQGLSIADTLQGVAHVNCADNVILDSHTVNDVFLGGRSRALIGPFTFKDMPASLSGEFMYLASTNSAAGIDDYNYHIPMTRDCRISGLTAGSSDAITAGVITITPWIDVAPAVITTQLDSSNQGNASVQDNNNDIIPAGGGLRVRIQSDASLAPVTCDIVVFVEITYKN